MKNLMTLSCLILLMSVFIPPNLQAQSYIDADEYNDMGASYVASSQFYLSTKFTGIKVLSLIKENAETKLILANKGDHPNQTWYVSISPIDKFHRLVNAETGLELYSDSEGNLNTRELTGESDETAEIGIKRWDKDYYQLVLETKSGSDSDGWAIMKTMALDVHDHDTNRVGLSEPGNFSGQHWFMQNKSCN